jgi:UDPglucose 6-dehydrogenase
MKLTIAGYGAVGQAHHKVFGNHYDIEIYDPFKGYDTMSKDTEGLIVCTATPSFENGACMVNSVYDVIERSPNVPVIIKSTISLEGWETLIEHFPDREITFSPEFLRNNTAEQDLLETKDFMFGGGNIHFWQGIFVNVLGKINIGIADPKELILVKYFRNSFLANKVAFFNQVFDLCEATGINYDAVATGVGADKRIGTSHTSVTKERGFGGHCFPKDIQALIYTAKQNGVDLTLLQEALEYNKKVRK